jgi:hypothetical protein
MAALGGGHPGKHKVFQVDWMAGSSPAIQWSEKFANLHSFVC